MLPTSLNSTTAPGRSRRFISLLLLIIGGFAALFVAIGSDRRGVEGGAVYLLSDLPDIDQQSTTDDINSSSRVMLASQSKEISESRIRIGTFNIHSGKGKDEILNLDRTAKSIPLHLDIVFLQEVRSGWWNLTPSQSEQLAQSLLMRQVFLPVESQWFQPHFGNALLSRREHEVISPIPLPCTQGKKYRGAVLSRFKINQTPVNFLGAHIDLRIDHDRQLEMLLSIFESLASPKILIGDLNTSPDQNMMIDFLARTGYRNVFASESHGRDWMIIDGLSVRESQIVDQGSSDHSLLWAELSLVESPDQIALENTGIVK